MRNFSLDEVLPMYMGVILPLLEHRLDSRGAPHVYGGDPMSYDEYQDTFLCSPCIWG